MGYQTGIRTVTVTGDNQPVEWTVDFELKTVTVMVAGVALGTFGNRMVAMETLGLVNVPAHGKAA